MSNDFNKKIHQSLLSGFMLWFKSARSAKRISTTGFSMIELVIYLAILAFIFVFVVFSVLYVADSYKQIKIEHTFAASSETAFDQILREIRDAETVDPSSSLGSHPGALTLEPSGKTIYLDSGVVKISQGTEVLGSLTLPDVTVTNLVFRKITTNQSEAVKVEMTLQSSVGETVIERNFQSTAVLRGSY